MNLTPAQQYLGMIAALILGVLIANAFSWNVIVGVLFALLVAGCYTAYFVLMSRKA